MNNYTQVVKNVRGALLSECIRNGVTRFEDVIGIAKSVSGTIGPNSIAGVKAAMTKGQNVSVIIKTGI